MSPYEQFYYYRSEELQAVRSGKWKLHVPHRHPSVHGAELGVDGSVGRYAQAEIGVALYDLEADPAESVDVSGANPDVVERMLQLVEAGRADIGGELTERTGVNARLPGTVEAPWSVQVTDRQ